MIRVYRISTCKYIDDLSGEGAFRFGGRWNSKGTRLLYSAENAALAMLESLAHITMLAVRQPFCMIIFDMPEHILELKIAALPLEWNNSQPADILKTFGDTFVAEGKALALKLPSVLMPENYNYLVNPAHPSFKQIKKVAIREVTFDQRFTSKR